MSHKDTYAVPLLLQIVEDVGRERISIYWKRRLHDALFLTHRNLAVSYLVKDKAMVDVLGM